MKTAAELLREGGVWLGAVRSWMQWHKKNGSTVIWGSDEVLNPPMTVRQVEEVAAEAAAMMLVPHAAASYAAGYADGFADGAKSPEAAIRHQKESK